MNHQEKIFFVAQLLIEKHGELALQIARGRALECAAQEDGETQRIWIEVANALSTLTRR